MPFNTGIGVENELNLPVTGIGVNMNFYLRYSGIINK